MINRIALVGCGNVGTALLEILHENKEELGKKYGFQYEVTLITDLMKGTLVCPEGLDLGRVLEEIKTNRSFANRTQTRGEFAELLDKSKATMLAEATPTNVKTGEPGLSHIRAAIARGISVTTTNKGPFTVAWDELKKTARECGAGLRYEGVVMSGTPLINLLEHGIAGDTVIKLEGILNGTTNFILTKMDEGVEYADALEEAKALGYAESDPSGDLDGWDAAAKVSILSRIVFGQRMPVDEVDRIGITGIADEKIAEAKGAGYKIKPIAGIEKMNGVLRGYVTPKEIPFGHPLASVDGVANALSITTEHLGEITLTGPGAGRKETGQALLADLIAMKK